MKTPTHFAKEVILSAAVACATVGCGGGGGSQNSQTPSTPTSFDTGTAANSVKSIALTALVETLYASTGYLVDDSVAYHTTYSSDPNDPSGKVSVSNLTCSTGTASVATNPAANASYSSDNSVLYELGLDAATCQIPPASGAVASTETGGVSVSEQYDGSGYLLNYSYGFSSASTDSSDDDHLLESAVSSTNITSDTQDATISGSVSTSGSVGTVMEQVDGHIAEQKAGVAAQLTFGGTFTRVIRIEQGQPTLVVGPQDSDFHYAIVDDASWGDESCLTPLDHSVFDIATPLQMQVTNNRLTPFSGTVSGVMVPSANDSEYTISITFTSPTVAEVKVVDSSSQTQTFDFDTNTLLTSTSICGGSAGFWQFAGRTTPLSQRVQGHLNVHAQGM